MLLVRRRGGESRISQYGLRVETSFCFACSKGGRGSCSIVHLYFVQPLFTLCIVFPVERVETDDNVVDEADEEEIEDGGGREEEDEEDEEFSTTTISSSTTLATTTKVAPPLLSSGCSAEERAECEQICSQSVDSLSNTSSVTCSCYRGFRLDADAKSCIGAHDHLIKCFV